MYFARAPFKRKAALFRCKAVLPCASPGPHFVWWVVRVARLCATALVLCWGGAQHACLRHACATRPAGDNRYVHYGWALHEREAALLRGKAVLSRASTGHHFVRWLAYVMRLRATALALSGEEA